MDRILISGLREMGVHGVLPEERVRPQPFEVDLELLIDVRATGRSDDLADTVDYGAVCESVRRIVASEQYQLLERLATRIAEVCRADARVVGAVVEVRKLRPPVGALVDYVAVRVERVTRAYIALGSNLGDRVMQLQLAVDELAAAAGVDVLDVSRVYETDPVGGPEQGAFLNAVVSVESRLDPHALLALAQRIERAAQRVRIERWGPRTLDVDLLLYDDVEMDDPELTLPHPRMWERGFVLAPLRDVAPALVEVAGPWEGVRDAAVTLVIPWRNNSEPSP